MSNSAENALRQGDVHGFCTHRDNEKLKVDLFNLFYRFFFKGDRSIEVVDIDLIDRRKDIFVPDIEYRLEVPNCHDMDLVIFKHFKNRDDLILDIGANWGYTVADLWSYGADTRILSFEPVKFYAPLLERIKQMRPGRYDYRLVALFDESSTLNFVVPVVNKLPIFALSSAMEEPDIDRMVENVIYHIKHYMPEDEWINVRIHEFTAPVDTLDNQLSVIKPTFSWSEIVAIKIDVEGLEYYVLNGALNTLKSNFPLIMLEDGNRRQNVSTLLESLGYRFAIRDGEKLVWTSEMGDRVNGFYVHSSRINEYFHKGIL